MKGSNFSYSIDDILSIESYENGYIADATMPSASSSPIQPLQFVIRSAAMAICLMVASPLSAVPVSTITSVDSVVLSTNQAIFATTQSSQFKKLVRGLNTIDERDDLGAGPYPFEEDKLVHFEFSEMPMMDPPIVETRRARVRVRTSKQSEPSFKDLEALHTHEYESPFV